MLLGNIFLTFDNANTDLDALFLTALIWRFQVRFSSRCIPTKDLFLKPTPYLSISLFSMKSLSKSSTRTFVFFLKSVYFVLEACNVFLFAVNQSAIFESSKNHIVRLC